MTQDRLTRVTAHVSILLSILTFIFGDNILSRVPAIDGSAAGTTVTVLGSFFLFFGFFATALYLLTRGSSEKSRTRDTGKAFYICCVLVTLAAGTLWDACTTLLGVQRIFQAAAPQASQVQVLIPTVIATGIIFLCILIPSAHVFGGTFHPATKAGFAPLFVVTMLFDVGTSIVGNAHFLLAIDNTSSLLSRKFFVCQPDAAVTLIVVTVFSSTAPVMLSIMFTRVFKLEATD